jgi:hypothetical protein
MSEESEDFYGALIVGGLVFITTWAICTLNFGFLGFALGWMPAAILGAISGAIWRVVVFLLCLGIAGIAYLYIGSTKG